MISDLKAALKNKFKIELKTEMKINLTLRVTGRREDGYHDLVSAFVKIPSDERIFINEKDENNNSEFDKIKISGLDLKIDGENIAAKVLRIARELGVSVPYLDVNIFKCVKPGSGLGSGSGNAAAMIKWLASQYPDANKNLWFEIARRTGADVPFLYSDLKAALVTGTGENLEPLEFNVSNSVQSVFNLKDIYVIIAFPDWTVGTREAYSALDNSADFKNNTLDEAGAIEELKFICNEINNQKYTGLLPNDFFKFYLEKKHSGYNKIFKIFDEAGCFAWGVTGSGSAAFALSKSAIRNGALEPLNFIIKKL